MSLTYGAAVIAVIAILTSEARAETVVFSCEFLGPPGSRVRGEAAVDRVVDSRNPIWVQIDSEGRPSESIQAAGFHEGWDCAGKYAFGTPQADTRGGNGIPGFPAIPPFVRSMLL
jgi:hypothetical protein